MNKISELPDHYTPVNEPYFSGKGNHSVNQLEELCEQYEEYAHQCGVRLSKLRGQNAESIEALREVQIDLNSNMIETARKRLNAMNL